MAKSLGQTGRMRMTGLGILSVTGRCVAHTAGVGKAGQDQGKAIKGRGQALRKAIKGRGKALGKATRGRGKVQSEMGNPLTLRRRRRTALRLRVRNGAPSSRGTQRMVMINGLENLMDVLRKRIPRA